MTLTALAEELGTGQRTLRRAADLGLVHGVRRSARKFEVGLREESYLRTHWPLLSGLRRALRTEPNVRLAVLFGSAARGEMHGGSDIDLLVRLEDDSVAQVAALSHRLGDAAGRAVQPVRLRDAERRPALLVEILADGRVLVDRTGGWPELRARERDIRRGASSETAFEHALDAIEPLE